MPHLKVHSFATCDAAPDQVWNVVQDFCAPWHPAISDMVAEKGDCGGLIRKFTVKGEDTIYRERLTYYSASEMSYAYTHVEGIQGVTSYSARLTVAPAKDGASVMMNATLSAPASRAQEIAEGTQAIFDDAVVTIGRLAKTAAPEAGAQAQKTHHEITTVAIDSLPQLAVSVAGTASKTLCLFLHGIGGNRKNWSAQLQAVAPVCQAAALDLRGYGDSTLGPQQSSIDAYCDDILRVMDVLGAEKLILCGLSYGAWIATSFAMHYPEKMAALIVSGGCTGMSEAGADERDAFRLSREVPMNEGQTPADFAPSVVDVIAGPRASAENRAELLRSMQDIPTATYADALRCFTNPLERFDFSKLDMPVLLMTGEHDRLAPPAEIKAVAERILDSTSRPDVRFETIADAGHVCNLERPALYNRYLTDFLSRVIS